MKKTINGFIWLLTIISLYVILSVELELVPKIHFGFSAPFIPKLNNSLLTLSYSYIAALIFYLLINYFPYYQRKKLYQPYVKRDIIEIHSLFLNMINAMGKKVNKKYDSIPDKQTFEYLMDQVAPNETYGPTEGHITQASYLKTYIYIKAETLSLMTHIHLFKEYTPPVIISMLEGLNKSQLFKAAVIFNSWKGGVMNNTMKNFANDFYDGFEIANKLKTEADKLSQ